MFHEIDKETLKNYISENMKDEEIAYEKLLIDKVDLDNTPTGIKTTSGDTSSTARGITETELINIFDKFNVRNASELSNGNKAIIYWNGRVINKTFGYSENGIKLPTALVVKPATLLD